MEEDDLGFTDEEKNSSYILGRYNPDDDLSGYCYPTKDLIPVDLIPLFEHFCKESILTNYRLQQALY